MNTSEVPKYELPVDDEDTSGKTAEQTAQYPPQSGTPSEKKNPLAQVQDGENPTVYRHLNMD